MISNLKSRRYFFAFFRREKESATRTWAGGCEAPHTRAKNNTCSHCRVPGLLVARSENLGSKKEFQDGGCQASRWFFSAVFRVFLRFVAIVCLNFKARLSFFSMYHLFFWKLTYFSLGFLHCLCFFIFYISQEYEIRLIICWCSFFNFSLL